jgi:hypothetical protein
VLSSVEKEWQRGPHGAPAAVGPVRDIRAMRSTNERCYTTGLRSKEMIDQMAHRSNNNAALLLARERIGPQPLVV